MLCRKLPAQCSDASAAGKGQQLWFRLHRQQQLGATAVIAKLEVVEQVQPSQHLGSHQPQDAVALPQQLLIAADVGERLFAQHFRVGPLGCGALRHQFIAPFLQGRPPGGGIALAQLLQLTDQGVEQGFAVIEQVTQAALLLA